jgi:putative nucleotidyltransferase with HDIG domain
MKQSDIYKLHKKYSIGEKFLEIGWTHSLIVKNIALQIANKLEKKYDIKTNKKLIEVGALIHDIGFYEYKNNKHKLKKKYIYHGKTGYEILLKEGISQKIARFALTHVGIGIKKDVPISLEEEIVCYADNFHSKGHPGFNTYEETSIELNKINPDYKVILKRYKDKFGIPDLKEIKNQYKNWHKEINEWVDSVK